MQYPVKANLNILVGGVPLFLEYPQGSETGAALILPGDLVEFTNPPSDCTVKAAQSDSVGVIGVANLHPASATTPPRGGDRVTAYAAGDMIEIIRGPCVVMLRFAAGASGISCGEFVQPAASGEVKEYVCGTDNDCQRIAQALETLPADTVAFQWGVFALERFG
ncbi:MAG: hypothetical protein QW390_04715 [Candidatus Bathyarchaeia archaeon]